MDLIELINDSEFLKNLFFDLEDYNSISKNEIIELLPGIKNKNLIFKLYSNNYNFDDDELFELLENLNYLNSKRILDILILIKHRFSTVWSYFFF